MNSAVVVDSTVFEQLDFAITRVKMQLVTSSFSSVKYQVETMSYIGTEFTLSTCVDSVVVVVVVDSSLVLDAVEDS